MGLAYLKVGIAMANRSSSRNYIWFAGCAMLLLCDLGFTQGRQEPGKPIGKVSTQGNLIVMTLDENVLGKSNLFDLGHHTLRFTPDGSRYRVESLDLKWDSEFGPQMSGSQGALKKFAFPFSGKSWDSFSVGMTGSITFGESAAPGGRGGRGGGISVDRFAELQEAARALINTVPAISVFFKPRMSGVRYLKELDDRVIITWSLTEPVGGIQDMTWTPTVNRFQAVLAKDGTIEMSYEEVAARDAIVGIYPLVKEGVEREIATLSGTGNTAIAPHLNIKNVKLASVDGLFLKATIETRGPLLAEGDSRATGITYRICLNANKPTGDCAPDASADAIWTIQVGGGGGRGGRGGGPARYYASGTGVSPGSETRGE